jgi:hypothetical protein
MAFLSTQPKNFDWQRIIEDDREDDPEERTRDIVSSHPIVKYR